MSVRATRVLSRIVFIVCGLTSLLDAFPYVLLRGAELPVQSEWIIFAVPLALVGLFSVAVGVMPRSRIAGMCRRDPEDVRLFSAPLKLLGIFAALGYIVALVAFSSTHSWHLNQQAMLVVCPMYFLKMSIDPSPVPIFFVLAPMNAGVFGSLGLIVGYAWLRLHKEP